MTQKSHVLFAAIVSFMMLTACDGGANGNGLNNQILSEITEMETSEEAAQEPLLVVKEDRNAEDSNQKGSTGSRQVEEVEEVTEEIVVSSDKEEGTSEVSEQSAEPTLELEEIDPVLQVALKKLLGVTELDKEAYRFSFEQTDEYIQVEVREKKDEVAPLEGIYRYMIETEEILFSDYLTGDFVPYN